MICRKFTRLVLLVPLFLFIGLAPIVAQELSLTKQVIERTLPNGLKVLMVKRAGHAHGPLHSGLSRRVRQRAAGNHRHLALP